MKWFKKLSSEPIMFLHAVAYMINISTLPQLVLHKLCVQNHGNQCQLGDKTTDTQISEDGASWWFIIVISSQVPAVFTIVIWGPISDKIGRQKSAFVIPTVNIIQSMVFILCSHYMKSHPAFLGVGMFLSCLFGEFPGVIALACSLIADVTANKSSKTRMTRMAFIDCAINIAGLPAGLFAGQLLQRVGFIAVFCLSIGLNIVMLLYIAIILPRNMKSLLQISITERQSAFNIDLIKPHRQIISVYRAITDKQRRHLILPPLVIFIFCIYGFVGELTTTTLYLKGIPISMQADFIGYYYANQAVIRSIGVVVTTQIARKIKISEMNVILIGLCSHIACFLLIGFSSTTLFVFLANIAGFAIPVPMSVLRSYTSTKGNPKDVGTIMAAFECFDALSYILNLVSLEIYRATITKFSGTVFVFLSGCSFLALCFTIANKFYLSKLKNRHTAISNLQERNTVKNEFKEVAVDISKSEDNKEKQTNEAKETAVQAA